MLWVKRRITADDYLIVSLRSADLNVESAVAIVEAAARISSLCILGLGYVHILPNVPSCLLHSFIFQSCSSCSTSIVSSCSTSIVKKCFSEYCNFFAPNKPSWFKPKQKIWPKNQKKLSFKNFLLIVVSSVLIVSEHNSYLWARQRQQVGCTRSFKLFGNAAGTIKAGATESWVSLQNKHNYCLMSTWWWENESDGMTTNLC